MRRGFPRRKGAFVMRMFQLDPRLQLCADLVRQGVKLADIGTDHAYLPVWLVSKGICPSAVAVDVREGPLERARENVARYGMAEKIRLSLSSGLTALRPDDADDIVIAGMGGELIAEILRQAPWVCDEKKHLILQPMTTAKELRLWLRENGFALLQEVCVRSEGKVYSVMLASYAPEKAAAFQEQELYPYIGLLRGKTEEEREYIRKVTHRLSKKLLGCQHRQDEAGAEKLNRLLTHLQKMTGIEREES